MPLPFFSNKKEDVNNKNTNNNNNSIAHKRPEKKKENILSTTDFEELSGNTKIVVDQEPTTNTGKSLRDSFLDPVRYQKNSSQYKVPPSDKSRTTWDSIVIPRKQVIALSKLKVLVRTGIPDEHRKKVWSTITGAAEFQSENPTFFVETLLKTFGEDIPHSIKTVPLFGGQLIKEDHPLKDEGFLVAKRLLVIFKSQKPNLDYIPCLPDLLCILLCFLSEEETYIALTRMSKNKSYYWNTSKKEVLLFCHTFSDLIKSTLPKLDKHFKKLNLDIEYFESWFNRLYIDVLPHQTVLRVFDSYLSEGYKILYRIGLAILSIFQKSLLNCNNLSNLKEKLNTSAYQLFDADYLMKVGFSFYLARSQFEKLHKKNKNKVKDVIEPVSLIYYRPKIKGESKFLREYDIELFWEWLPNRFKIRDAKMIFCTANDGFNLKTFYSKVENISPLIIVIKTTKQEIFGLFITSPFDFNHPNTYYGRRDCFLFSLKPNEKKYVPVKDGPDLFISNSIHYLIFGGGNGTAISIDENFLGNSSKCDTFQNEPLSSSERGKFDVACLEVWAPN